MGVDQQRIAPKLSKEEATRLRLSFTDMFGQNVDPTIMEEMEHIAGHWLEKVRRSTDDLQAPEELHRLLQEAFDKHPEAATSLLRSRRYILPHILLDSMIQGPVSHYMQEHNTRSEHTRTKRSSMENLQYDQANMLMAAEKMYGSTATEVHERVRRVIPALLIPALSFIAGGVFTALLYGTSNAAEFKAMAAQNAKHAITISSLQAASKALNVSQAQVLAYLPHLTDIINRVAQDSEIGDIELDLKAKFVETKESLRASLDQIRDSLRRASLGQADTNLLSDNEASRIQEYILQTHNDKIDITRSSITTKVGVSRGTITVGFTFPVEEDRRTGTLYKIVPYPIFSEGKRYTVLPVATHVVVMDNDMGYILVSVEEAIKCQETPRYCYLSSPMITDLKGACGVSVLFNQESNCDARQSDDLTPFFMGVGNITIYSVATPQIMYTHCAGSKTAGAEASATLEGNGMFATAKGCYVQTGTRTIIPSDFTSVALTTKDATITPILILALKHKINADTGVKESFYEEVALHNNIVQPSAEEFMPPDLESTFMVEAKSNAHILAMVSTATAAVCVVAICIACACIRCKHRHIKTTYTSPDMFERTRDFIMGKQWFANPLHNATEERARQTHMHEAPGPHANIIKGGSVPQNFKPFRTGPTAPAQHH